MRVGNEIRSWEEGKCLIFDDTVEHEVWHRGVSPRAVLLVDFARSDLHRTAAG
jgi:aspartyl/asparaginyl beta-hydroxylase (cupin superfamily)